MIFKQLNTIEIMMDMMIKFDNLKDYRDFINPLVDKVDQLVVENVELKETIASLETLIEVQRAMILSPKENRNNV